MIAEDMRQQNFYSFNNKHKVLIAGAGSIGSYVAFGLARMGVKDITVVDFDTVANHNLPNQFFSEQLLPPEENTILKTVALQRTINMIMPSVDIRIVNDSIMNFLPTVNTRLDAFFVCVDDMNIRKQIWNYIKENPYKPSYLIDARVGGLYANIFSIETRYNEDNNYYEKYLWSNEESAPLPCTGTAVIDVTLCIAGECIGRFRQAMKHKLQVIHTFHAYNIGSSAIMAHRTLQDDVARTDELVANIDATPSTEVNNV